VLASTGEVAVMPVDHGQAGAHVAGEVEGGDAGTEREGGEGVAEIVDPSRGLGRIPPRSEIVCPAKPVLNATTRASRTTEGTPSASISHR
jgi:hypothetical protein